MTWATPLPQTFPVGTRVRNGDKLGTVDEWQGDTIMRVSYDDGSSSIGAAYPGLERMSPMSADLIGLERCRGCGAIGKNYTIAEDCHAWVEDDDDLGYPYCAACITELREGA